LTKWLHDASISSSGVINACPLRRFSGRSAARVSGLVETLNAAIVAAGFHRGSVFVGGHPAGDEFWNALRLASGFEGETVAPMLAITKIVCDRIAC
jgi:hypothetical protein